MQNLTINQVLEGVIITSQEYSKCTKDMYCLFVKVNTGGRIARWSGSSVDANRLIAAVTVRVNSSLTLQLLCAQAKDPALSTIIVGEETCIIIIQNECKMQGTKKVSFSKLQSGHIYFTFTLLDRHNINTKIHVETLSISQLD